MNLIRQKIYSLFLISAIGYIPTAVWSGQASIRAQDRAWELAVQALSHNIVPIHRGLEIPREIVLAGANQFRTTWSWDFAFASPGLIKMGRADAVRDTLISYFEKQREDGLLPRTLDTIPIELRVLLGLTHINRQFKGPLKPWYVSENRVVSPIPNFTLIGAAANYIQETGDKAFAHKWFDVARAAVTSMEETFDHDGLIGHQAPFSDWEDSVARTGRVAFTNLMHLRALRGLKSWAEFLKQNSLVHEYENRLKEQTQRFLKFFWDDEFAMVKNFEDNRHVSADAQLFAIADGVLSQDQARRAFETLEKSNLNFPMPGRPTWPTYPNRMKSFFVKIGGMTDYHDELYWGWLAAQAAMARAKIGDCQESQKILQQLSELYSTHDEVGEVYELNKHQQLVPVKRLRYRSEAPFTWAAGMYLEAASLKCRSEGLNKPLKS